MVRRIAIVGAILAAFALENAYAQGVGTNDMDTVRTPTTTVDTATDDDGFDMGWLGIIGLAGLAGMIPRDDRKNQTVGAGHTTTR
jgi:hypothetical protein